MAGRRGRPRIHVAVAVLSAAVLPVLASAASAARGAESPAQVVRSADGGLVLAVPRGALRSPVKLRIRTLARAGYPAELRGATFRPGSQIYALEPAGTRFLKRVSVTRRLDAGRAGFDLRKGMPHLVLVTRDGPTAAGKGRWTVLGGHTSRLDGRTLTITARLRHFSTLVTIDGRAVISMTPLAVTRAVGQSFLVESHVAAEREYGVLTGGPSRSVWVTRRPIAKVREAVVTKNARYRLTARCDAAGTGSYFRRTVVYDGSIERALIDFLQGAGLARDAPDEFEFLHEGTAVCVGAAPVELVAACWLVAHQPFDGSPSSVALQLGTKGVPPGSRAEMRVGSVNGGNPVTGTVDASGKVALKGGITSYGPKPVQAVGVAGTDVTQKVIALAGPSVNVTSAEGVVAGTCP